MLDKRKSNRWDFDDDENYEEIDYNHDTWGKRRKNDSNVWDKKRLIVESAIAIFCVILGTILGKTSNNTYFYNGQKVSETELNAIMEENAEIIAIDNALRIENIELSNKVSELVSKNIEYEQLNEELSSKNISLQNLLENNPTIELQNCGLSIDGNEEAIDTSNAYAIINGRQYYSRDFINALLPDNMVTTMKDNMLYVGKIIKNKTSIFDLTRIKDTGYETWDSIIDTYGNTYSNVLFLRDGGWGITYNANREYSNFKCVIAMKEGSGGKGYIQIETDDENYTYISPEINNLTEKFIVDIPINYTSTLTIKCVNGDYKCNVFVSNAILYNQE